MRVNFPGYDGALPEQWPDCHCILWPFLGEDRWLQAWSFSVKAERGRYIQSGEIATFVILSGAKDLT
jgi:hypothetical protein